MDNLALDRIKGSCLEPHIPVPKDSFVHVIA